jgi:Ca-activated chloride channel family protein
MSVNLSCSLSDRCLDSSQGNSQQRQLAIKVSAISDAHLGGAPLNLCLVLDRSGSMGGKPLDTVKAAATDLVDRMHHSDRLSVVAFDHKAKVIIENQTLDRPEMLKDKIQSLKASGGTCIDDAIKLGLQELGKGKEGTISQAFVLTDGENEHGDNDRCLQFARLATEYNITLHTLGFGDAWNQDVLERIADAGGGSMAYIASPDRAADEFNRLLRRVQSVGLTNAYLLLELAPNIRLAELKPIAQVEPDAIELPAKLEGNLVAVRLGDLMTEAERVVVVNLYINANSTEALSGNLPNTIAILTAQIRYDHPAISKTNILSDPVTVEAELVHDFRAQADPSVQNYVLALAKYRQTQLAEDKLKQGDRTGAATMLQSAAKTALQMGDRQAATVLQSSATRLQSGSNLSEAERKTTRIVSKTVLQKPSHE